MASADQRPTTRNTKSQRKFSNNVPPGLHYLPPLNPKSEEFVDLFRSFLSSKDERTNILALSDEDARLFIEIIDRAFRAARLETELRQLAFSVLASLCERIGHLPDSYLLSDKFDVSGSPRASGGFADVRMGTFKGKKIAVKSLRVSPADDIATIRKRFCKEVAMWKNLSHPNILNLIGVPDTLGGGRFSMVSEWMANGNIMEYVRNNAGNHLKLLADAIEGLKYLHNADIVHGDLKGANILITNHNPATACLADFGFMTIASDPGLGMTPANSEAGGGTTPFMAPELLVPTKFGLDKCTPSKEADVYAMAMAVYHVLTGTLPFGKLPKSEVVPMVLGGGKPLKPANALELGLSDQVWKLLDDCWQSDRRLRPSVKDVLNRVNAAASVCGTLSSVGGVTQRQEDPDSDLFKFDQLVLEAASAMVRPPSRGSTHTDISLPDSLFSKVSEGSEIQSPISEPDLTSSDALAWGGPYWEKGFAEPLGSSNELAPTQREQPRFNTAVPHDREACVEKPAVGDPATPPLLPVSDAADIAMAQAREDPTRQLRRPASALALSNPKSRPIEKDVSTQIGDNAKHQPRQSRFRVRQWLGRLRREYS